MTAATVTLFQNNLGTRIDAVREITGPELEQLLRTTTAATKNELPLLKLATFGNKPTSAGCLRHDENVLAVHGIEGDYDDEKLPMSWAAENLRELGVQALLHTTSSHTEDKPRWHVLCPLAHPLTGTKDELQGKRRHFTGVLNAILKGVLKSESFVLSQSFYYGRIAGKSEPQIVRLEGLCIDELARPPAPVFPINGAMHAAAGAKGKDKTDSADLLRQVHAAAVAGKSDEEIYSEFANHPHVIKHKSEQKRKRAIKRCIDKARDRLAQDDANWTQEDEKVLLRMNAKHAVINWNGKARILTEIASAITRADDTSLGFELSSHHDFKLLLHTRWHNDEKLADWWLNRKRRREFQGVVFAPGQEVPDYYNLWRGFAYEPKPGDCSLWLRMIEEVICCGDKAWTHYVLSWLADLFQNPTARPGVVLVLKGEPGTGKGTLARTMCKLLGSHAFHATSSRQLVGQFNKHLSNKLLVFADEAFYAGDKKSEGTLKALITEPTLQLEPKGQDIITVPNYLRIIMASNLAWVVPAALRDRRFAIFEVSDKRAQDIGYFTAILDQMDNGGYEALLHFLLHYDMGGIDLRKLPETQARWEQQVHSMTPIEKWWHGRLQSGAAVSQHDTWQTEVLKEDLLRDYIKHAGITGERFHACRTELGMGLKKLVPGLRPTQITLKDGKKEKRVHAYQLPSLAECRAEFTRILGHGITWQAAESAADLGSDDLFKLPDGAEEYA